MRIFRQGVALFAVGLAQFGCSAQAEPDYPGEPLALVTGKVVTTDTPANGDIDAALLWNTFDDPSLKVASAVVHGSFPANFTMEVLSPPPASHDPNDAGLRFGIIAAIKHQSGSSVPPTDVVGTAVGWLVVYYPRDANLNDPSDIIAINAAFMKVPATRGYHLARVTVTEESEGQNFRCEYDGLCEHVIYGGCGTVASCTPEELAIGQGYQDERFELCTKYLPDAPRCDVTSNDGQEHPEEAACVAQIQARSDRLLQREMSEGDAFRPCEPPWIHLSNPDEFAAPVTVTLGTNLFDAMSPLTLSFERAQPSE
jgi:hypothetical protein